MGCLVDTFIICLKDNWREIAICTTEQDIEIILSAIPDKYGTLFHKLIKELGSLDQIIDTSNYEISNKVFKVAGKYETDEVKFSDRYRGECLQQIIRKTFYDTLLVVENDFNWDKCNRFIVVRSNNVITEEKWANNTPGDQAFIHKVAGMMVESGKIDACLTIDGKKYTKDKNGEIVLT
jgi:hypothetical protein